MDDNKLQDGGITVDDKLQGEAQAFDRQIHDRIKGGHIPDLRRTQFCEYFYNNSWRHPEYVKLDMGEQFDKIQQALRNYLPEGKENIRVLEVGCGPGWLSLELARAGYEVTGIDVSSDCILIAQQVADTDPWKDSRGTLTYIQGDFFSNQFLEEKSFDAVVFQGALHHFKEQDQVMNRVISLLKDGGIVMAHEPTRDRMTEKNAAIIHMLQTILAAAGGFYKQMDIPLEKQDIKECVQTIYRQMKYEDEAGDKTQSVNDNEAGFKEMYEALSQNFEELLCEDRYGFFHELIGGLRFEQSVNIALARYLREIDQMLCQLGSIQATEFFFVGRKK